MKNLITIFAVLALSLVSCKKEKPLQQSGILTYHAVVEIDAEEIDFISKEVIYKNGSVVSDLTTTPFNFGDTITIKVKNTWVAPQNVSIELSANDNFIKGSEQDLQSGETLTLKHIF